MFREPRLSQMARAFFILLWIVACCVGRESWVQAAATPKTVVVITVPSVQPLARRLGQEIESLGLVVKWISAEGANASSLEHEAMAAGAVASIRVAPAGSADVELTIFEGATGKTASWKVTAATTSDPASAEITATRTIELLRASLLEMAADRRPSVVEVLPVPEAQPSSQPWQDWRRAQGPSGTGLFLLAGPSLLYSAHWQPGVHSLTTLTWMPIHRAGVSISLLAPLTSARLTAQEGAVDLFATFYRLGAVLELTSLGSPVSLRLTTAMGLGWLHLIGDPALSYAGISDDRFVASPSVGVTTRLFVAPNLSLFGDVMGSAVFPKTVIRLAGREVSTWGHPVLAAAIGLELGWDTSEVHRADVVSAWPARGR
jgi:hypothetical protein